MRSHDVDRRVEWYRGGALQGSVAIEGERNAKTIPTVGHYAEDVMQEERQWHVDVKRLSGLFSVPAHHITHGNRIQTYESRAVYLRYPKWCARWFPAM